MLAVREKVEKKLRWKSRFLNVSALQGASIDALQELCYDWMQETHMLSASNRKTINAEVTNHVRYTVEGFAELSEDESI